MNAYMKNSIVNHAWHEFLYGYNTSERKEFLKSMADSYPVKFDSSDPVAIYIDDFMLPVVSDSANKDRYREEAIAREYFSFVLVSAIVEQTMKQVELEQLNERMKKFINNVNRLFVSDDMKISDIESFRAVLETAKNFYKDNYVKMMETGVFDGDINSLTIAFMDLNMFATYYKRALGMNKHFAIVLDYPGTGTVVSQKAVNGLVTRRITGDYSIKIACEPQEWKSYYDFSGQLAEVVHDYSAVALDSSYAKYVKELRNKKQMF